MVLNWSNKMKASEDITTTTTVEENLPAESLTFPKLPILSWSAEFSSESTIKETGQSSAELFTIDSVKKITRSSSMPFALQSSFQSSSMSTIANEDASSSCQSNSSFVVDSACKSREFSNASWMVSKESGHSPSSNWEAVISTLETLNPDTKNPFDMQAMLASLGKLPENVQHEVMCKLYMLSDFRDRPNVFKEGCSSGGTQLERLVATTLAVCWSRKKASTVGVANGKDSGCQSHNDSDVDDINELSQIEPRTSRVEYDDDTKSSMIDLPKANEPDGDGSHLALQLNSKCSFSDKPHFPSCGARRLKSLLSSEPQNNRFSDEMRERFGNLHLANNVKQQSTEEKCDLSIASKSYIPLSQRDMQRMYIGEPLHACPVCKRTFRSTIMLKIHAQFRHKENRPFPCTVCERKFDRYLALTRHMYSHGVGPTYECDICDETFNYHPRFVRHIRLVHYEVFGLTHPSRSMLYPFFPAAEERLASHSDSAVVSSRTEEPSTSVMPGRRRDVQLFPCVFCGKVFSNKLLFSQHRTSHEFRKTYKCETCGQTFNFQSSLAKHQSIHPDSGSNACSVCGRTFSNPIHLKKHRATHLTSTDVKLQIKKTPFAVPSSRAEPNPTAMARRGLKKEFACTFCDKSYDTKTMRSQHMKSHEWRSSYKCETCGEIFNFHSSLMKHQSENSHGQTSVVSSCSFWFE